MCPTFRKPLQEEEEGVASRNKLNELQSFQPALKVALQTVLDIWRIAAAQVLQRSQLNQHLPAKALDSQSC